MIKYFILSLFVLLSLKCESATIHTIIVADTTEGENSYGTESSVDMIHRQMKKVAAYTGSDLQVSIFEGHSVTLENVKHSLENLVIKPEDSIVFYVAMHGSRRKNKKEPWPDLNFPYENVDYDFGLLLQVLKEKNPKFLLAIAESCNNIKDYQSKMSKKVNHEVTGPTTSYFLEHADFDSSYFSADQSSINHYNQLFQKSGSVVITSSIPGQYAVRYHKTTGGFFTLSFLRVLRGKVLIFGKNQYWKPFSESNFNEQFQKPDLSKFVPKIPQVAK